MKYDLKQETIIKHSPSPQKNDKGERGKIPNHYLTPKVSAKTGVLNKNGKREKPTETPQAKMI